MGISTSSQSSGSATSHKCRHTGGLEFEKALQRYLKHAMPSNSDRPQTEDELRDDESHAADESQQTPLRL